MPKLAQQNAAAAATFSNAIGAVVEATVFLFQVLIWAINKASRFILALPRHMIAAADLLSAHCRSSGVHLG